MRLSLGFSALAAALVLAGCGGKTPEVPKVTECAPFGDGVVAPQWVCIPFHDDLSIAGVGSAPKNKGNDFNLQSKQAQAAGRDSIAMTISANVRAALDSWARNTGVAEDAVFESNVEAVSRQTSFTNIKGSKVVNTWSHPKSGMLYILMAAPIDQAENAMMSSLKNQNALWQQFQSAQAQDKLKDEFEQHVARNGGAQ